MWKNLADGLLAIFIGGSLLAFTPPVKADIQKAICQQRVDMAKALTNRYAASAEQGPNGISWKHQVSVLGDLADEYRRAHDTTLPPEKCEEILNEDDV